MENAFLAVDAEVEKEPYSRETGTTSCVVLITADEIYCANAGDSRGVLKSGDKAVPLSLDHKPELPGERRRIQEAGHSVGMARVDGNLALSRAFGDFQYKDKPSLPP